MTQSWDALADAVLTHDIGAQTTAWAPDATALPSPLDLPIDLWPGRVPESVPCADPGCRRLMMPGDSWSSAKHRHQARGLCGVCYERHRRRGSLDGFSLPPGWGRRAKVSRDVVVEEFAAAGWSGVPVRELPSRLGMSRQAFERALFRARAAGDPRAAGFRGRAS